MIILNIARGGNRDEYPAELEKSIAVRPFISLSDDPEKQYLADIALSYDEQLSDAYTVMGRYYYEKGLNEQALTEFDKALKINPNDWMAFQAKGALYFENDMVNSIANYHTAISIHRGPELPSLFRSIGMAYLFTGFPGKYTYYFKEALNLDGDSAVYYSLRSLTEYFRGNFTKAVEFGETGYSIDSSNLLILGNLGMNYMILGNFKESLKYYEKYINRLEITGYVDIRDMAEIGYVYWHNGFKEKADYYFNEQIN